MHESKSVTSTKSLSVITDKYSYLMMCSCSVPGWLHSLTLSGFRYEKQPKHCYWLSSGGSVNQDARIPLTCGPPTCLSMWTASAPVSTAGQLLKYCESLCTCTGTRYVSTDGVQILALSWWEVVDRREDEHQMVRRGVGTGTERARGTGTDRERKGWMRRNGEGKRDGEGRESERET